MKTIDNDKTPENTGKTENVFLGYSNIIAGLLQNELSLHRQLSFSPKQRSEDFWKQICAAGNR
jgi:hypothetical protein